MIIPKCNECKIIESKNSSIFKIDINCSEIVKGPTGSCVTDNYAYAANTSGSQISVTSSATNISLPNEQKLPSEYAIADENNEIFTIINSGIYLIKYTIYTTVEVSIGSRLMINGVENNESIVNYGLNLNRFSVDVILDLMNNTQVSLQIFGTGTVTLLSNGVGAELSIIRLA